MSLLSLLLMVFVTGSLLPSQAAAFSKQLLYGVPGSGWTQKSQWNWGSAVGTGHDCARICREQYSTRQARVSLVESLQQGKLEEPANFEEVKLVLALAWQRGRWDGSDGGRGGYGEVLETMVEAKRYEEGPEAECSRRFVEDMASRFSLLNPTEEQCASMQASLAEESADAAQRRCSGLVLEAMGFIDNGI